MPNRVGGTVGTGLEVMTSWCQTGTGFLAWCACVTGRNSAPVMPSARIRVARRSETTHSSRAIVKAISLPFGILRRSSLSSDTCRRPALQCLQALDSSYTVLHCSPAGSNIAVIIKRKSSAESNSSVEYSRRIVRPPKRNLPFFRNLRSSSPIRS